MPRKLHYAILGVVCALVIGVYGWSAKSLGVEPRRLREDNTYYNLLVEGFRAGQIHLRCEVPPELAQLDNPAQPPGSRSAGAEHHPLTDVSYYRGKLYLYFGVTPALLLFWPYRALTGHPLWHQDAVLLFFSLGYLVSVGLLWAVWRRYFAALSVGVVAACALAVGLTSFVLLCLPRSSVYEVAISCGYALTMVTLLLLWQAIHAARGRGGWLAGASLAYGLAVGARPSLGLGAIILLAPVAVAWRERAEPGQRPRLWTLLLAATAPITVIALGLLLYNYLRFDDPVEFGQHYVLSWNGHQLTQPQHGVRLFSPGFFWYNVQAYFLAPAHWSGRFPFVRDITLASRPAGHRGTEHVFGVLAILPLVWLALAVPLIWRGRLGEARHALRGFGVILALLFGSCALTLCLFFTAYSRYQVEFLPALVWLAVLGILGMERALSGRPEWQWKVRWGWGLLMALAVAFNGLATVAEASRLYMSRGVISLHQGSMDEAMVQFQKALQLQSDNAEAHCDLGAVLYQQGRLPEDIKHQEEALRLKPDFAEAHYNLGNALLRQGKVREAVARLEQALRLKPELVEAHNNLGVALAQLDRRPEAIEHLEQALRLKPGFVEAHNNLGLALAQLGQGMASRGKWAEAITAYQQAIELSPDNAQLHDALGMALSQIGRFPEAVRRAQRALELSQSAGQADHARQVQARLQLYQASRPYHEAPTPDR